MKSFTVVTRSEPETRRWGIKLGHLLSGGEIIGLIGELGVGKTCFVRGVAQGLKVNKNAWIRSPSFTLINEYEGRLPIYHIDLYRISSREETEGLNLREYLYGDGVSLVEWFEHLPAEEADEYLELRMAHGGGDRRKLNFIAHGERYERLLAEFKVPRSRFKVKA
ncbi:MAG: tRNA (adenosine(37)-N6)-threonylcarbamoyltransferase complex ATPase subunit type 1 TsaE [Deltaproteobacteria bacterium]|nr:tRNA (adenosine(37)-N6)-threonylcarbamoyltransferase complex ATPase subunit type 1 TsaE [Deltaproteobacteria bacterium]MBI2180288.1 tRNA (adenosine(37)-N6)-threonylcarbamoyltransferase complex ATPase subunit type 1 TsaE [Deltaproteobacteria bacterium]MBI2227894.1 tRNA (adenosine(37)-N6)-threonylcarbamoyltransferase complex ATPase subunit type 1 TsaE [Deltaproteobacteria bacterium]